MITKEGILKHLKSELPLYFFDELDSTNLYAKRNTSQLDGDAVIIAARQSGGRGRLGRSFFSPEGGLYLSIFLKGPHPVKFALNSTTAAAVAVCRAVEKTSGKTCGIKWVNDVYVDGRKVCGILTEGAASSDGQLSYAVVGIGINLTPPEGGFPDDIRQRAGAVFEHICDEADVKTAAAVIDEFIEMYLRGLEVSEHIEEYRRRSVIVGREVNVMRVHDGEGREATAVGIDEACRLVVRYPDGTEEAVESGEVTIRM